jgi:hypothetical protein
MRSAPDIFGPKEIGCNLKSRNDKVHYNSGVNDFAPIRIRRIINCYFIFLRKFMDIPGVLHGVKPSPWLSLHGKIA